MDKAEESTWACAALSMVTEGAGIDVVAHQYPQDIPPCRHEAEMGNAAKASPRPAEWSTSSPNKSLTRVSEEKEEATFAAGACREVLQKLIPPRVLGKEALSQLHSEIGPITMVSRDSLINTSKSLVASVM